MRLGFGFRVQDLGLYPMVAEGVMRVFSTPGEIRKRGCRRDDLER